MCVEGQIGEWSGSQNTETVTCNMALVHGVRVATRLQNSSPDLWSYMQTEELNDGLSV